MDERKILLQQKIKVNKQKSQRTKLMNLLPQDLAKVIENNDFITSPELEIILDKVHKKWNYELNRGDFAIKYIDFRKEFSWEQEVIEYVQELDIREKTVYLYLGLYDSPIFIVNGKWAIKNFNILWQCINNDDIWIFGLDLSYGVLVSRYGGYLEHDPNPKEIFYAITKWDY